MFSVRRADIETFARDLEAKGRATVTRRLCTIAGFHKYAVEEELLEHSPAAHVRRPRLDYESHATGLDRNELGAILVAAGLGPPAEHALISLLALNGLRVSEATGADIEQLGLERGHRTLVITRRAAKWSPSRSHPEPRGRSTWRPGSAPKGRSSSPPTAGELVGCAERDGGDEVSGGLRVGPPPLGGFTEAGQPGTALVAPGQLLGHRGAHEAGMHTPSTRTCVPASSQASDSVSRAMPALATANAET